MQIKFFHDNQFMCQIGLSLEQLAKNTLTPIVAQNPLTVSLVNTILQ